MESKPIMDSETGDFPGFIVSFMGHLARRPGYEGGSIHLFLHASWLMLKVPLKKRRQLRISHFCFSKVDQQKKCQMIKITTFAMDGAAFFCTVVLHS